MTKFLKTAAALVAIAIIGDFLGYATDSLITQITFTFATFAIFNV